jgi:hypothetical protein
MFTDLDEYPTHQIVAPHGTVSVDSPGWTDRYYFSCFCPDGSVVLHMGVGVFPNLRLVEAWSCSVVHEKGRYFQINVRPSASYDGSPWPLRAGPLSFELVAPQRRWRIVLDESPYGASFELELDFVGNLFEAAPVLVKRRDGTAVTHTTHYVQLGGGRGSARIDGHDYRLEDLVVFRDRSWGIRSPGEGGPSRGLLNWVPVRFGERGFCYYLIEREDGSSAYMSGGLLGAERDTRIESIRHDLEFEPGTRIFKQGRLTMRLDNDESLEMSVRKLTSLYLKGGGYFKGGHGVERRGAHVEGERWDLTSLDRQQELLALNDNISEFRLADGTVGYGVFELSMGRYPRYGFTS